MQLLNELSLLEQVKLVEDFSWDVSKPLDGQLQQAIDQLAAAKRALAIANRFRNPVDRAKHRGRIMGMLNRIRASLGRLQDAIAGETEAMQQ